MPRTLLCNRSRHCSVAQWMPTFATAVIVLAAADGTQQSCGEPGAERQLGHAHHAALRRDRHDAGDDRHLDAGQVAALAEVVEVAIVEEELRADVVGAGVHLSLQVVHLLEPVRRGRVPLGEAGDADAEAARVGDAFTALDERDQVARVAEGVRGAVVVRHVLRRVAAQGQNVVDARVGIAVEDGAQVHRACGRRRSGARRQ